MVLGISIIAKTGSGPGCVSHSAEQFLRQWGFTHRTGIPPNPTGQAVIERARSSLKNVLQKQKRGNMAPQEQLENDRYI